MEVAIGIDEADVWEITDTSIMEAKEPLPPFDLPLL